MSKNVYSVSTLVRYIKESFQTDPYLQSIFVKGEVSNFTNHRSGHWYFTLKDHTSRMSCVMFSSYASKTPFILEEGMNVVILASVSMYEASGSCQLYVTHIERDGIGDLFLRYEKLKKELASQGLFANEHKKALPLYPMEIGIISAKEGAATADMLTTLHRRWPLANIHFYPSLVQGKEAAPNIIENLLEADQQQYDVILLARGGGSIEDLWAFNDERLARCIYSLNTPIVSGVGHETDTTLADYVSDARAATPTAAAELITPNIIEVEDNVQKMKHRMNQAMQYHLQFIKKQLDHIYQNPLFQNPLRYIGKDQMQLAMHMKQLSNVETKFMKYQHQLDYYKQQLKHSALLILKQDTQKCTDLRKELYEKIGMYQQTRIQELQTHMGLLDALSPLKILQRGYNIVYKDQTLLKSITAVKKYDEIKIRMADGRITAIVKESEGFTDGKEKTI